MDTHFSINKNECVLKNDGNERKSRTKTNAAARITQLEAAIRLALKKDDKDKAAELQEKLDTLLKGQ